MLYILSTLQDTCKQGIVTLKAFSARAPGSLSSQTLAVGALAGFLTYSLMKKRYRLPPGPRGWPLLGNLLSMGSKEESFYVTLQRWAKEYGPVVTVYMGPILCITLNDYKVVNDALVLKGEDFAGRPFLHSLDAFSEGSKDIAAANYSPAWKLRRKIAMQALKHYMRGPYLEKVVHDIITMVMDEMAAEASAFDPRAYNRMLMFHIIHTICFGERKPFDDPSIKRLADLLDSVSTEFGNVFWEDIVPFLRHWPTKKFRSLITNLNVFFEHFKMQIDQHQKTFSPDNIRDMTDSILLAQSDAAREESAEVLAMFTDTHVRQTISDLFGAGVDTTRMTLDWTLLYIAGHPEIQKRAQAEIDAVTGVRLPGVGDRQHLQYTEAVLYEAMRLGTVAPTSVPRNTLSDTTIAGYEIPKDTMVLVNLWAVNHDPEIWDEPVEFKPERFLDEQGKLKTKVESWMPFSAGRRACLGESVARPELLLLLACLLKRFTISLPKEAEYDPGYDVSAGMARHRPKPYKIVVTPR